MRNLLPCMVFPFHFPFHFSLSPLSISSPFLLLFPYCCSFLIPFSISFLFLDLFFFSHNINSQRYRVLQVVKNHLVFWKNTILPVRIQCFGHGALVSSFIKPFYGQQCEHKKDKNWSDAGIPMSSSCLHRESRGSAITSLSSAFRYIKKIRSWVGKHVAIDAGISQTRLVCILLCTLRV